MKDTMTNMASKVDDTIAPFRVVPHTPSCVAMATKDWSDHETTILSLDVFGNMMSILFSDGEGGIFWYRFNRAGADFGLAQEMFK